MKKPLFTGACTALVTPFLNGHINYPMMDMLIMRQISAGIRALVVDDEPMNLVVAMGIFKEYGFVVETAESGKEAIQKYIDCDYAVVFMDHMMPEMDGVEAMKQIRQVAATSRISSCWTMRCPSPTAPRCCR